MGLVCGSHIYDVHPQLIYLKLETNSLNSFVVYQILSKLNGVRIPHDCQE